MNATERNFCPTHRQMPRDVMNEEVPRIWSHSLQVWFGGGHWLTFFAGFLEGWIWLWDGSLSLSKAISKSNSTFQKTCKKCQPMPLQIKPAKNVTKFSAPLRSWRLVAFVDAWDMARTRRKSFLSHLLHTLYKRAHTFWNTSRRPVLNRVNSQGN